jgi:predicted aldo/keto reductase-like oxidoreductase
LSADDALGYVLSWPAVSTVVIGCQTPAEVEDNVRIVHHFSPFDETHLRALEAETGALADRATSYKRGA